MPMSEGPGLVIGSSSGFGYVGQGAIGAPDTDAAIKLSLSANIAAGGANTTAQLTPPASGSFGGGRIQDDENPTDAVNLADNEYREDEWCMQAQSWVTDGWQYEFRLVLDNETVFDTYTVTPVWTIGSAATPLAWFGELVSSMPSTHNRKVEMVPY